MLLLPAERVGTGTPTPDALGTGMLVTALLHPDKHADQVAHPTQTAQGRLPDAD
jgi:hypothetical protein